MTPFEWIVIGSIVGPPVLDLIFGFLPNKWVPYQSRVKKVITAGVEAMKTVKGIKK